MLSRNQISDVQRNLLRIMRDGETLYLDGHSGFNGRYRIGKRVACREKTVFSMIKSGLIISVGDFKYQISEYGKTAIGQ